MLNLFVWGKNLKKLPNPLIQLLYLFILFPSLNLKYFLNLLSAKQSLSLCDVCRGLNQNLKLITRSQSDGIMAQ